MKIILKHEFHPGDKIDNEEIINLLLKNRQIENIEEYLHPLSPLKIHLTDFGPPAGGWEKTIKLLEKIKKNGETIIVYTDYDADGITGGAILWETLHLLGFKVMPYVPHRILEGYGFSVKGIDTVKKEFNPSLIISVDHGISAREKIKYAKSLGINIIVTDHHLKPEKIPEDATAIFHIPALSGSGVAYFFAKEIFDHFKRYGQPNTLSLQNNFETDYLALASIGSIADLVPLTGPTRSLVKHGLDAFNGCKRIGLKHIIKEAGIDGRKITPYEIGFIIAPRINAVGRLEHAIDALRLLCTHNDDTARKLASRVGMTNKQRQDMVVKAIEEAKQTVEKQYGKKLPKIIILENKNWHEGIIGLIASKIAETYYRPTVVITDSDGFMKGSARSIPSFHITNFLRDNKKYLIDIGGHKGAAGFTMEKEKYNDFVTAVGKSSKKLIDDKDLEKTIEADLKLPVAKATVKLVLAMEKLQPFGAGNPQPVFLSRVEIMDAKLFGKKQEHVKIYVKDPGENSFPLELISFYNSNLFMKLSPGQVTDVVYSLLIDRWNGRENVRGKLLFIS